MVGLAEIEAIASEAASTTLGRRFSHAVVENIVDSQGDEIVKITIVLTSGKALDNEGRKSSAISFRIREQLRQRQEERFALIYWATRKDMADAGADP